MNVYDSYGLPPHVCFYCRLATTPCVDLQRDDEDNPNKIEHIYLCKTCLFSAVRIIAPREGLALVTEAEIVAYREALDGMRDEVAAAREETGLALAARDALVASYGPPPEPRPPEMLEPASRPSRRRS